MTHDPAHSPNWLLPLRDFLEKNLGHQYASTAKHPELIRNFKRAALDLSFDTPEALLEHLRKDRGKESLLKKVAEYLTIGETYFFRERDQFEPMMRHILKELLARKKALQDKRIRIWSAGCASGEEPYSIGMMLDHLLEDRENWSIQILATDINSDFLRKAREGVYRNWSFRGTPEWAVSKYFRSRPEGLEVDPRIREWVKFDSLNLAEPLYPSMSTRTEALDLIFCRNVLIYFSEAKAFEVTNRLKQCLRGKGYLILSPTELSLIDTSGLTRHVRDSSIYFQQGSDKRSEQASRRRSMPAPVLPRAVSIKKPAPKRGEIEDRALPLKNKPVISKSKAGSEKTGGLGPAQALLHRGDPAGAKNLLSPLESKEKLNPDYHYLRAMTELELENRAEAEKYFKNVLYLEPQHAMTLFTLMHLNLQKGEEPLASRFAHQLIEGLSSCPPDQKLPGDENLCAGQLLHSVRAIFDKEALSSI